MKNKFNLTNKLILITGCSSGIGYETLLEYSKYNVKLALIGRSEKLLNDIKDKILVYNKNIEVFPFDLIESDLIDQLIEGIENKFHQSIDVLINCAGLASLGNIENIPIEAFNKNYKINYLAPLILSKKVLGNMINNNSGQIIFIHSGCGKRGLPSSSPYCASKAALAAFVESLRVEIHNYNIDIISVYPGIVNTNIRKNAEVFGSIKLEFNFKGSKESNYVAKKIIIGSIKRKNYIYLSVRTYFGVLFSFLFPKLVDFLLTSKIK